MLRKKDLTIETEFFEETLEDIPNAILISPIYEQYEQEFIKSGLNEDDDSLRAGAQMIEQFLTTKLIDNFMFCWNTLKKSVIAKPTNHIHRVLSTVERISSHQSYIKYPEAEDNNKLSF